MTAVTYFLCQLPRRRRTNERCVPVTHLIYSTPPGSRHHLSLWTSLFVAFLDAQQARDSAQQATQQARDAEQQATQQARDADQHDHNTEVLQLLRSIEGRLPLPLVGPTSAMTLPALEPTTSRGNTASAWTAAIRILTRWIVVRYCSCWRTENVSRYCQCYRCDVGRCCRGERREITGIADTIDHG